MTWLWFFLSLKLPEDFAVVFGEAEGELAVGGVFLRIFIAQPAWVLRKPREFLIALLEKLTELLEKNNPHVSFSHQQNISSSLLNILMGFLLKHHPHGPYIKNWLLFSMQQPGSNSDMPIHLIFGACSKVNMVISEPKLEMSILTNCYLWQV